MWAADQVSGAGLEPDAERMRLIVLETGWSRNIESMQAVVMKVSANVRTRLVCGNRRDQRCTIVEPDIDGGVETVAVGGPAGNNIAIEGIDITFVVCAYR